MNCCIRFCFVVFSWVSLGSERTEERRIFVFYLTVLVSKAGSFCSIFSWVFLFFFWPWICLRKYVLCFVFLILRNEDSWTLVSLIIAISLFQGVIFFFFILFCYFFVLACEE